MIIANCIIALLYYFIYHSKFLNCILNYKDTVSAIDTNDDLTYGTGVIECNCQQHKDIVDENHGHVLAGDLRILANFKLRKLISKSPNFREAMSINLNKCKNIIEIGLDSRIKYRKNSSNKR